MLHASEHVTERSRDHYSTIICNITADFITCKSDVIKQQNNGEHLVNIIILYKV